MAVTGAGILYLIAKSIQIDCNYCNIEGNAIPTNKCFIQTANDFPYASYQFVCGANNKIHRVDYANSICDDSNLMDNTQTYPIESISENDCSDYDSFSQSDPCGSNEYVLIEKVSTFTQKREEKGIIINKCLPHSTPKFNKSNLIQCTQENEIVQWTFADSFCTELESVSTYAISQWFEFRNTFLSSIVCPICDSMHTRYDLTSMYQPNIKYNYIVFADDTKFTYPQPFVCNQFSNFLTSGSYKYNCFDGRPYKLIWTESIACAGLYDYRVSLSNVVADFNCLNSEKYIWSYSESAQPAYITLSRYDALDGEIADELTFSQVSYISNACIRMNDITYIIVECQSSFMSIHYFSDSKCSQRISECMDLFESNSFSLHNNSYFDVIAFCVGGRRTSQHSLQVNMDVSRPLTVDLNTAAINAPTKDEENKLNQLASNYVMIRQYKEAVNECNEYYAFGSKHSYKYVCGSAQGDYGSERRIKKRKWINIRHCDDEYDEEEEVDPNIIIDFSCDHTETQVQLVRANCFESDDYYEQSLVSFYFEDCI